MSQLTLSIIQSRLNWEDKQANLQMFEHKITGIKEKTELVVLPEMFSTGFSMQPELFAESMQGETVEWMRRIAATKNCIITGSVIIEDEGNYYNRLIWMLPNGQLGYYDKRHLFGFAGEDQHYSPGSTRLIASVKGWKINLQVCYDLRFPVWARQTPVADKPENYAQQECGAEYHLLLYVANWPERRNHAWKTLLQARAIENQCYVVGVNRVGNDGKEIYHSGDSMIIDPLGEIVHHVAHEEQVFTTTLQKENVLNTRERFPFWKDADKFNIF